MTTRLTTLLCSCLFIAVAACGDDGGNNNGDDTCGDGQKTGTEQCDDGNTTNGDGCSATCRNESSGPVCGDGVMSGSEECDDSNTTSGDGCSATCMDENGPNRDCGNGMIDGTEDCDDGNGTDNDGCTACNVDTGYTCNDAEPSVCTPVVTANGTCAAPFVVTLATNADGDLEGHAMGDTTNSTNQVAGGTCGEFSLSGRANDHEYKFTLATAADVLITGGAKPAFDVVLRLSSESCSVPMQVADDLNGEGCSDGSGLVDPDELYYVNLPAGTYYLTVDGYDTDDVGAYDVTIFAFETFCGDGELDIGEECDTMGAAGCSERCDVVNGYTCDTTADPSVCELACGNGVFDPGAEECEPLASNTDVCSATCTLISDVMETEPNNTTPNAIGAGNHRRIRGALAADDIDLYSFTLTVPSIVELETYDQSDGDDDNHFGLGDILSVDCDEDIDTTIALYANGADYADDDMSIFDDDDDGANLCSYVGPNDTPLEGVLEPGTYVIRVKNLDDVARAAYILDVFITPASAPAAGDLVINEYMANDGVLDTNCDGAGTTTANTDDEFVELANAGDDYIDLTGVQIEDGSATPLRHTFAAGATGRMGLLPGESVVVWAGGTPMCTGVENWFTASTGSLGLNNSGAESITVRAPGAGGAVLATVAFSTSTAGVSANLNPDLTGTTYALHNTITGHVGDFSPGLHTDGTAF